MAMSRNDIIEKLKDVLQMAMPTADFSDGAFSEASELVSDIGLSSVGVLYVVIAIEEFFGIEFENVGFGDFATIGDVINYIEEKQQ